MASRALTASAAAGIKPDVVYVPRPSATPAQVAAVEEDGTVAPLYTASPAPMGLAYYGLSGTGTGSPTATTLTTTAIQGSVDVTDVQGADLYQAAPDSFSIQLNAVLTDVTLLGTPGYTFWTQGIATYFPSTQNLLLVTNIWNFSGQPISNNALYADSGSFTSDIADYGTLGFYYSESTVQGVAEPFDLVLTMTSSLGYSGDYTANSVTFGASLTGPADTTSFSYPDFDTVTFNSVSTSNPESVTTPSPYTASGTGLNPLDLTDDFELVICGPGGGSNVDLSDADATLGLAYYDTSNFVSVPAAYSYGGDTGESSIGANVAWSDAPGGPSGLTDYGTMDTGPSILSGLWGTGAPEGTSPFTLNENPSNAFNFFVYHGTGTFVTPIVSQYEYAPSMDTNTFYLMPGNWSIRSELSGYSPSVSNFYVDPPSSASPHPGTLDVYEVAPGGISSESLDPSVCYETACAEPVENVYETLVTYDGNNSSQFLPVLSTCVPGAGEYSPSSVSCEDLYGQSLVVNNLATGLPEYWTFPIDKNARFYDASTHASWPVYPSDVMFSFARTMSYADLPVAEFNPGWIQSQALLPSGQQSWDGGIHSPYNNTPSNILGSMLVNNTTYCPAAAMAANGCITFVANGGGANWPFFLQLVAQPLGASIQSCGWDWWEGAGLPGFPGTSAAEGDGPCWLPGDATNTGSSAFQAAVSAIGPMEWDHYQELADGSPIVESYLQYAMVGSGPYYLATISPDTSYSLGVNPDYAQPNCGGVASCYPEPGTYASSVDVNWETSDGTGLSQYEAGEADFATISASDTPTLLDLQSEGKIGLLTTPTLNQFFEGFFYNFDAAATQNVTGVTTNIQGNFFSYVGMREFLAQSFPYGSFINVDNTIEGVTSIQGVGGAIPQGLGNYYPTNISWPGLVDGTWQDPSTNPSNPGSAAWWWAEITNPSSPYYDPEAVACESSTCEFPMTSAEGLVPWDEGLDDWSTIVSTITDGAIQFSRWDPSFATMITQCDGAAAGTSPCTSAIDGWLPDYPDPTDYMAPFYLPDGSYTTSPGLDETFVGEEFGGSYNGCTAYSTDIFANLVYWANVGSPISVIPQDCQGTAYAVMTWAVTAAATMPLGPERTLYYNLIEHIANGLALYVYAEQQVLSISYASWIDPATVNTNPMFGGSGEQLWFNIREEGTLDINLPTDVSTGVYTPLWAFSNSQVAALSPYGLGTAMDPYVLINDQPAPLSSSFGLYNDYGFPVFPGVFLQNTYAWVELYEPPSFNATTNDSQFWGDDLPQTNALQYWFWGVTNLALVDATNISGWFGGMGYSPLYFNSFNVVFYDSEDNLVAGNSFFTAGQGLLMYTQFYEPDSNTVWGNQFIQIDPPLGCPSSGSCLALLPYEFGLGLELGEDYDLVYNNVFATPTTAWLLPLNLVTGFPETYPDNRWNIAPQPASNVNYLVEGATLSNAPNSTSGFPTIRLTGSIVGGATQGGNSWWDQGVALNWDNGAVNTETNLYDENAPTLLDPLNGYPTYTVALMSSYACDPTAPYNAVPEGDYYCMTYIYGTTGGDNAPLATLTQSVSFGAQDLSSGGTWGAVICGPSAKGPGGPSAKGPGGSPSGCGPSAKGPGGFPPGEASRESLLFTNFATTAADVNILVPPGTFYWSIPISPPGQAAQNQLGTFTVTGPPSSPVPPPPVSTTLAPGYTETATESGLPAGSVWWFNVTGRLPLSNTTTGSTITVNKITEVLPDGTFSYVIRGPPGYTLVSGSATGTFIVNGATPPGISVTFGPGVPKLAVSPSAGPNPTQAGALVTISAGDTGGVAPYTYSWSGLPDGCLSPGDQETFSCTPTASGAFLISLSETDSEGDQATGSFTLTINAALTVSPSATHNPVDVGQSTTISAGASNGVGSYTYQWSGTVPGCTVASETSSTFTCTPSAAGSYTITVTATDAVGSLATGSYVLMVNGALTAPTISVSTSVIDSGQSGTLSTTTPFSGGTSSYGCQWLEMAPGASSYSDLGSSFVCTSGSFPSVSTASLTTTGTWYFGLQVTDSGAPAEVVDSNVVTVAVHAALLVAPSASPNPTPVGASTTISAGDSGGVGPYVYVWSGTVPGCSVASETSEKFSCTPTVAGSYKISLVETDSVGSQATGSFTLVVGVTPAITVSPTQGPIGARGTVTGSGFTPSSGATVTGDGVPLAPIGCTVGTFKGTTITTTSSGTFQCTFIVPIVLPGTYSVVGHDLATGKSSPMQAFTVTIPVITVTPTQGPIGATVTVAGTGFSVSSTVGLVFDGVTVKSCAKGGSLTTNSAGGFSCTLSVPSGTSGSLVVATDVGGLKAARTFVVTTPKITVTPGSGLVGSTVTVSGTGFSVSSTVGLNFDGVTIKSCTGGGSLTTSSTGSFSCTFKVPSGTTTTTVTATDASGQAVMATFKVT